MQGARRKELEAGRLGFPTGPAELSSALIRGPSGLPGVFLVIHLFLGPAAPQQVGGAGEWLREHGAYETN